MSQDLECPLCGKLESISLAPHLSSNHSVALDAFRRQFPELLIHDEAFRSLVAARDVRRIGAALHYQLDVAGTTMTARHGVEHPLIPDADPTFVWTDACRDVAEALEHNERAFLFGPSGTGKSSLVRQLAALTQRPVRRVSLNGETSVSVFIGHWTVTAERQTVFVKGILPQAMLEGHILQLDEVDAMQPEIGFILQQVLEPGGRLLLTDTGEEIAPHDDFRLVATANTLGFGSDSGLYASGTHVLNFSWLDRWDVVVHIDYLPLDEEVRLLGARFPSLDGGLLTSLVRSAGDLRKAHAEEQLTATITTRRLLALCARLNRGNEFQRALQTTVLNKVPTEDRKVIAETFDHHVGPVNP